MLLTFFEGHSTHVYRRVASGHSGKYRLVLLPKGNKPPEEPSSYQPLCLLDITGKLFERVICARLETAFEDTGGLADNPFGFKKARSTIVAIGEVVGFAKMAISGTRCTKRMCDIIVIIFQKKCQWFEYYVDKVIWIVTSCGYPGMTL